MSVPLFGNVEHYRSMPTNRQCPAGICCVTRIPDATRPSSSSVPWTP